MMTFPAPTSYGKYRSVRWHQAGFTLIELMIAIALSLLIVAGLGTLLVNLSSANRELRKVNSQIENGRFAVQVLQNDIMHAGYWGTYMPQFNDVNWADVPADTPTAEPDPCLAFADWDFDYRNSLIGMPLQSAPAAPGTCTLSGKKNDTDVLIVRHAATCMAGSAGCDPVTNGKLYFQSSECGSGTSGMARAGDSTTITLEDPATAITSSTTGFYVGMMIRTTGGTGAGQSRVITAYNGGTNVATVNAAWTTNPDSSTTYAIFENILDTAGFTLHQRGTNCAAAPASGLRKFVSNMYWIRDYANTAADNIPTLVRSSFDPGAAVSLQHQETPDVLVENIEAFRVEFGVDNIVTRCALNSTADYTEVVDKVDPSTCVVNTTNTAANTLPTNRGDGIPDQYIRCPSVACTPTALSNVVAAKIFVLARSEESSPGYTDEKTYCLGSTNADGTCPAENQYTPANTNFKYHVFSTTMRLPNISARRETP